MASTSDALAAFLMFPANRSLRDALARLQLAVGAEADALPPRQPVATEPLIVGTAGLDVCTPQPKPAVAAQAPIQATDGRAALDDRAALPRDLLATGPGMPALPEPLAGNSTFPPQAQHPPSQDRRLYAVRPVLPEGIRQMDCATRAAEHENQTEAEGEARSIPTTPWLPAQATTAPSANTVPIPPPYELSGGRAAAVSVASITCSDTASFSRESVDPQVRSLLATATADGPTGSGTSLSPAQATTLNRPGGASDKGSVVAVLPFTGRGDDGHVPVRPSPPPGAISLAPPSEALAPAAGATLPQRSPVLPAAQRTAERVGRIIEPLLGSLASGGQPSLPEAPGASEFTSVQVPDTDFDASATRTSNTLNVSVAVGDIGNAALDREALRDALTDILRESARRHGLDL